MTEALRDYLEERFLKVRSGYGASDLTIGMAGETDFSVWVRRRLRTDAALRHRPARRRTSTGCRWCSSTTRWRPTWRPRRRRAALHDQLDGGAQAQAALQHRRRGPAAIVPRGAGRDRRPGRAGRGAAAWRDRPDAAAAAVPVRAQATARSRTWAPTSTRRTSSTACTPATRRPTCCRASAWSWRSTPTWSRRPVVNLQLRAGRRARPGERDGARRRLPRRGAARTSPRSAGTSPSRWPRTRPPPTCGCGCTTTAPARSPAPTPKIKNVYLVKGARRMRTDDFSAAPPVGQAAAMFVGATRYAGPLAMLRADPHLAPDGAADEADDAATAGTPSTTSSRSRSAPSRSSSDRDAMLKFARSKAPPRPDVLGHRPRHPQRDRRLHPPLQRRAAGLQQRRLAGRGRRRWRTSRTSPRCPPRTSGPPVHRSMKASPGRRSRADLRDFCDLPLRLHPRDRYVPLPSPVIAAHRRTAELFLVRDGAGRVVGRTSVHRDAAFDAKVGPRQLFGHTEFVDDDAVFAALMDAADGPGRRARAVRPGGAAAEPDRRGDHLRLRRARLRRLGLEPRLLPGDVRAARLHPPLRGRHLDRATCPARPASFTVRRRPHRRRATWSSGTAPGAGSATSCRSCARCSTRASRSSATTPRSPPSSWPSRPTGWRSCSTRGCCCGWRRRAGRSRSSSRCRTSPSSSCGRRPARHRRAAAAARHPVAGTGATRCSSSRAPCRTSRASGYLTLLSRELHRNLRDRRLPGAAQHLRRAGQPRVGRAVPPGRRPAAARLHVLREGRRMTWVEELRAHEAVFRRAPSAHNTQPWTLDYRADEVVIGVDPARSLPDSDPTGRDLALGLGAFVETCLIVAADAGLAVTLRPERPAADPAGPGAGAATRPRSPPPTSTAGGSPAGRTRPVPSAPTSSPTWNPASCTCPAATSPATWPSPTGGCSAPRGRRASCGTGCGSTRATRGTTATG